MDIDVTQGDAAELNPEVTVARIGQAGPAGTRQVTAGSGWAWRWPPPRASRSGWPTR